MPWPLVAAGAAAFAFFSVMGRLSLPIIATIGDNRVVYMAAPTFSLLAALMSGAPGPFWSSHPRHHDIRARSIWCLVLILIAAVPPALVLRSYDVSSSTIAPLVALNFAAAMVSTVLLGRTHAGYAGFVLTIVAMFSSATPAGPWLFGWIFTPSWGSVAATVVAGPGDAAATVGLLGLGVGAYLLFGDLCDTRSAL